MEREVKYIDRGVEHAGSFEVDGWMLELTCAFGRRRVALGLFEPKALARRLLRTLVAKAEHGKAAREIVVASTPVATIEAAKAGPVSSVRTAVASPPA